MCFKDFYSFCNKILFILNREIIYTDNKKVHLLFAIEYLCLHNCY